MAPSITAEIVLAPGNCLERLRVLRQIAPAYQNPSIYHSKRNNPAGFSSAYQVHHRAAVTLLIWFTRRPAPTCAALCCAASAWYASVWLQVYGHMHSSLCNLFIIDSAVPTVGMVSGISISVSHCRARTRVCAASGCVCVLI